MSVLKKNQLRERFASIQKAFDAESKAKQVAAVKSVSDQSGFRLRLRLQADDEMSVDDHR